MTEPTPLASSADAAVATERLATWVIGRSRPSAVVGEIADLVQDQQTELCAVAAQRAVERTGRFLGV